MSKAPGSLLLESCSGAKHVFVAAPYIKVNALERLLAGAGPIESLVCVTRWSPDDIVLGASDLQCRAMIDASGGSFRLHPSLHAKYYRFDNVVFVGSANLTLSGMGWTSQPNMEILCYPRDDFNVMEFERCVLRDSREVDDGEYVLWEALGRKGVAGSIEMYGVKPELDRWRPVTRDLRNLELAYRERVDAIASFDEQGAARRDMEALCIPAGLSVESFRTWISICLLSTNFVNSVIELSDVDRRQAANVLAQTYGLSLTGARRDMETVQNWLAFLKAET